MIEADMTFADWLKSVPPEITDDPLWKIEAYRLALFAADLGWFDVTKLVGDKRTVAIADQLFRALGSVSGNIEEGYSRGTGRDGARFHEYAFGSAHEARGWYYKGRHVLSPTVALHRMGLLTQIIRLLATMIPDQRGSYLHETVSDYLVLDSSVQSHSAEVALNHLLISNPMP